MLDFLRDDAGSSQVTRRAYGLRLEAKGSQFADGCAGARERCAPLLRSKVEIRTSTWHGEGYSAATGMPVLLLGVPVVLAAGGET